MTQMQIPTAAGYPWAPNERQISFRETRKRKGSGFAVVQKALAGSTTSSRAKEILVGLLGNDVLEGTPSESQMLATFSLPTQHQRAMPPLDTINPNAPLNDEQVLLMAKQGRLSLLGSIIRVVHESISTPVSTKRLLETCMLAVPPKDVPGEMDGREMCLAGLIFLSSTHNGKYWTLPLIRPTQQTDSLLNRSYEIIKLPTESQLQWLETAFLSSADKYLPREKLCPRLQEEEEGPLLLKGTVPPSATADTPAAKRRATLAAKAAAAAAAATST